MNILDFRSFRCGNGSVNILDFSSKFVWHKNFEGTPDKD